MASFYLQGADELARELNKLAGEVDQISMKMVDEAADIMDKELSTAIKNNTQKYGTGTLAASIHHEKPRKNETGAFTVSTARGRDTKSGKYAKKESITKGRSKNGKEYEMRRMKYGSGAVRNHDKLWYLENGNSRQSPRPIIAKCVRRAEPRILSKMQAVFNRETRNL